MSSFQHSVSFSWDEVAPFQWMMEHGAVLTTAQLLDDLVEPFYSAVHHLHHRHFHNQRFLQNCPLNAHLESPPAQSEIKK